MSETYSFGQKKDLCQRIHDIPLRSKKKEQFLLDVFSLINPDKYHENKNGIFLYFQSLPFETYLALEELVSAAETTATLDPGTETLDAYVPLSVDELSHKKGGSNQFRYSNKERSLIKKHRYDKQLQEQSEFFDSEFETETHRE